MLDWIRYMPIAFTRGKGYITTKGPYFSKLKPRRWLIGDSTFHFQAPTANPVLGGERTRYVITSRDPKSDNILRWPLRGVPEEQMPSKRWQYGWFYRREWVFTGPWFTGYRASLNMSASVLCYSDSVKNRDASLLHPKAFEIAVADYLDSNYGHRKVGRNPHYRGPLNWGVLNISPTIQAALFDIHTIGNTCKENPGLEQLIVFPISPNQLVKIMLIYDGSYIGEPVIDLQPLYNLANDVIRSFRLEVGPTLLKQWQEANADSQDTALTSSFAELKWPINPKDIGKAGPLVEERSAIDASPKRIETK